MSVSSFWKITPPRGGLSMYSADPGQARESQIIIYPQASFTLFVRVTLNDYRTKKEKDILFRKTCNRNHSKNIECLKFSLWLPVESLQTVDLIGYDVLLEDGKREAREKGNTAT